jgi:asparagine synthase (glutamine-hydrolysing)
VARVRETLERSVVKRLMSDVPLGAFLSGGLDSSLIAALVRPHVDVLHTFSVGVEGSPDLEAARVVARHLDSVHHEHRLRADEVAEALPDVIFQLESFDQDLVRSAIPTWFTARLASDSVKVILTGEGADELFAGYGYYRRFQDAGELQAELRRSVRSLHNVNLQRVDRMTMAHSLEARVPFLDPELVAVAQRIRPEHKLHVGPAGVPIEKWVLRRAVEDLLPPEIAWKKKDGFDQSTRAEDFFAEEIDSWMDAREANRYRAAHPFADLRTQEEAVFHRILSDALPEPETILNMGRWSDVVKW